MTAPANNTHNDGTADLAAQARFPLMVSIYVPLFFVSEIGNGVVIYSLAYLQRRQRTVVDSYILNLAFADILITTLTLFNAIEYKNEWKLGEAICKVHGQILEVCYTVSVLTLLAISYNRYKAVNDPFKALNAGKILRRRIVFIWSTAFVLTSPLAYAYTVEKRKNRFHCSNTNFDELSAQVYYLLQAVILFFVPILVMVTSQRKITRGLQQRAKIFENTIDNKNAHWKRVVTQEKRIGKFLTRILVVFVCCFTPYIIMHPVVNFQTIRTNEMWNQIWHATQLLALLNSAINPFLYYRTTNRSNAKVSRIVKLLCCIRHKNKDVVSCKWKLPLHTSRPGPVVMNDGRCN